MTDAESRYIERHAECCTLVERITEALGDMDAPSERTHWGQVQNLATARTYLRQAAEVLGVEL